MMNGVSWGAGDHADLVEVDAVRLAARGRPTAFDVTHVVVVVQSEARSCGCFSSGSRGCLQILGIILYNSGLPPHIFETLAVEGVGPQLDSIII